MKYKPLYLFLAIALSMAGCIGTDEVQDTISSIDILPPENATVVNDGNFAKVVGQEASLQVEAKSDLGGTFIAEPSNITWNSDNPAVASVSEEGVVSAIGVGTANITATFTSDDGIVLSDEISVSVAGNENAIVLIEVSSDNGLTVIAPGEELQLNGVALNASGIQVPSGSELLEWTSSDENVATVDQEGLVTGVSNGEVTITVSGSEANGSIDLVVGESSTLTRTASFQGLSGYSTSGDATLETNSDGALTLRFAENFKAQNGPGLYVYLSNSPSQITGAIELDKLARTEGAQTYIVPANVGLTDFNHIVLYCKPFGVGFGTAPLSD